jgi:hypothetical protein
VTEGLLPLGADSAALQTLLKQFASVKEEIVVAIVVVAGVGKAEAIERYTVVVHR